eukprot:8557052-Alexandrium_andersonii.AAC.1
MTQPYMARKPGTLPLHTTSLLARPPTGFSAAHRRATPRPQGNGEELKERPRGGGVGGGSDV